MEVGSMKRVLSKEDIRTLVEMFPDHSDREIAEALGISICTVKSRRTKMGLRKSPEYLSRINRERAVRCGDAERLNTKEAVAKRVKTMGEKIRTDKMRLKWGMEQRTKRHFRTEPRERLFQRNRLRRLGYVVDEQNLVAYWTPETHRAVRLERIRRGEKKGSLKCWYDFAELPEKL